MDPFGPVAQRLEQGTHNPTGLVENGHQKDSEGKELAEERSSLQRVHIFHKFFAVGWDSVGSGSEF